jgi:hypothetical protein
VFTSYNIIFDFQTTLIIFNEILFQEKKTLSPLSAGSVCDWKEQNSHLYRKSKSGRWARGVRFWVRRLYCNMWLSVPLTKSAKNKFNVY